MLLGGDSAETSEDALLKDSCVSQHHAHAIRRRMNTLRSTVRSGRGRGVIERGGGGRIEIEGGEGGAIDHSTRHEIRNDHSASHRRAKVRGAVMV